MSAIRSRLRCERGQTIFILPIAFLIVLILGSATLEASNLFLRQRQLEDLADSAASDAAGFGFDSEQFRADGTITIIENQAQSSIVDSIDQSNLRSASVNTVVIVGPEVSVEISYTHDFILGRQIFGASQTLTATGNATLVPSP